VRDGAAREPRRPAVEVSGRWERSSPAKERIDPQRLAAAVGRVRRLYPQLETLLIIRHGKIVFERYYAGDPVVHTAQSVTKSVTSLLVGIALRQGAIASLEATLGEFVPAARAPGVDPRVPRITLRQLLQMRVGFQVDILGGFLDFAGTPNWVDFIVRRPLSCNPGACARYDDGATHLIAAILTSATGMSIRTFARQHLFTPIGIPSKRWLWEVDPQGIAHASGGLSLTPRDMARFGLLLLNGGRWNGRQVVPAEYVREATRTRGRLSPAPGVVARQGYGYQFWTYDEPLPAGHGFAALGYGGQSIIVFPKLDLVIVSQGPVRAIPPTLFRTIIQGVVRATRP
jgi:CubicO group peptidase (beta-lactamase class C family)